MQFLGYQEEVGTSAETLPFYTDAAALTYQIPLQSSLYLL